MGHFYIIFDCLCFGFLHVFVSTLLSFAIYYRKNCLSSIFVILVVKMYNLELSFLNSFRFMKELLSIKIKKIKKLCGKTDAKINENSEL